jgi:nitric oxide reductase subunit B
MVVGNLFPEGILQLSDVIHNGYWHARGAEYLANHTVRFLEWMRLPGDGVFIVFGVVPLVIAAIITYATMKRQAA